MSAKRSVICFDISAICTAMIESCRKRAERSRLCREQRARDRELVAHVGHGAEQRRVATKAAEGRFDRSRAAARSESACAVAAFARAMSATALHGEPDGALAGRGAFGETRRVADERLEALRGVERGERADGSAGRRQRRRQNLHVRHELRQFARDFAEARGQRLDVAARQHRGSCRSAGTTARIGAPAVM